MYFFVRIKSDFIIYHLAKKVNIFTIYFKLLTKLPYHTTKLCKYSIKGIFNIKAKKQQAEFRPGFPLVVCFNFVLLQLTN